MPSVLIAKEDGAALLDFDLRPGKTYVIGRSAAADVRLEAQSISRLHAILFLHNGTWRLTDLGSTKGLRTESGTVRDHFLVHGGWVAIGPAVIWFFDETAEANEGPPARPPDQEADPTPSEQSRKLQILMIKRPDREEPYPVALVPKSISLGSNAACDVTIDVSDLAGVHLVIFKIRGVWHAAGIGDASLLDSEGAATRCALLSTDVAVQAGPLKLSLMDTHLPPPAPHKAPPIDLSGSDSTAQDDPFDINLEDLGDNGDNNLSDHPRDPKG